MPASPELNMSAKRDFSEMERQVDREKDASHETTEPYQPHKKQKFKKHKAKEGSMNWLKKRARTIERRFQRDENLPIDVKRELERELASHRQTVDRSAGDKKRKNMIKKYHMIRFFGRWP